jgi:UDP-N-acetylglucosamine--N-acetylmuramyl-(pentapeptide) pyrophosphoryl-undecaprenol N-acetylglucosamine transferase
MFPSTPCEMEAADGAFVLAGGGTGGHVFPAVAVARELAGRPGCRVVFVGTRRGLEASVAPREGFPIEFIPASGFVGKPWSAKAAAVASLAAGVVVSRRILRRCGARAVLGVGGYASLPVLLAARLSGVPSVIHEQNSVPGVANRIANRIADATAAGFESACGRFARPCVWTGNPVRREFFETAPLASRPPARRLLVVGGSQGARVLNAALIEALPRLARDGVAVTAQTGAAELDTVRSAMEPFGSMRAEAFFPRIWEQYGRADLIVCRSGALTVAELCASGRPSILVPFGAAAHGHQEANARELERRGGALVRLESEWDGRAMGEAVAQLLADPDRLRGMGEAARAWAQPDAARRLADLLRSVAREAA